MKKIHQSWFVIAMCVGVIVGAVIAFILKIDCFSSFWWVLIAIGLLLLIFWKPLCIFVLVAFLAGNMMVFFRASQEFGAQKQNMTTVIDEPVTMARDWFAERIDALIPAPENKLGKSYLLGMKSGLPNKLSEYLRVVGLTHIVVASGAHLSILIEIARKIFGKLSRFSGLLFSLLFIILFMAMVGWTPSIMRAGVMAILTLLTWYVGRKVAPIRMIIMVMAFTLMVNPLFINNVGWMLSFASYAGIMLLGPSLTKYFYGEKKPGFVGSMILTTIAATIMTLPITLYYFGAVSLISVIANLLILPTLSFAMGLTFLTGMVAGIPVVGETVGFMATKLLDYHIGVIEFFGEMEQFLVQIPQYQMWVFLIYVLVVAPFIIKWVMHRRRKRKIMV